MDKKENFYIFLDIDGVLWDWKWRKNAIKNGKINNTQQITEFNPKSVEALNYLSKELNKKYNVKMVISSSWRHDMNFVKKQFDTQKINYNGELYRTTITNQPERRSLEIIDFLYNHESGDFVIIDDEKFDFDEFFSKEKIIKTSIFEGSLSKKHIDKWLENNNQFLSGQSEKII